MADSIGTTLATPARRVVRVPMLHRLYFRIYLALLLSLVLASGLVTLAWRLNADSAQLAPSLETFGEFAGAVLPAVNASDAEQQAAISHWQPRVRADLALYGATGRLIAAAGRPLPPLDPEQTSSGWIGGRPPVFALKLPDGRWLVGQHIRTHRRRGLSMAAALALIAAAIAVGAYPVVRRLTRRLERLQASVEALGTGMLSTRVAVKGQDEVARLAHSFNRSATRIEALIAAQRTLLVNASHELRSPLARIRMAIELLSTSPHPQMQAELAQNVAELDQLIDEILLASRLDAAGDTPLVKEEVDLTGLLVEECARVGATLSGAPMNLSGDPKLLRRLIRNLLENARRYGDGSPIEASLQGARLEAGAAAVALSISDAGPGVPELERENIFAPFYRLPGARERDGGVGLGLSLVRQIARRHGGEVVCLARDGGGTCFRVTLPI